jgi:hypothetical protein
VKQNVSRMPHAPRGATGIEDRRRRRIPLMYLLRVHVLYRSSLLRKGGIS